MSKNFFNFKIINFLIILFILQLSQHQILNNSQVMIFSSEANFLGNPYDEESEKHTINRNCNMTEYPEQAIKCGNRTHIICEDEEYLHHCRCVDGYMTFAKGNYTYCNYKQKKQLFAFLLEFCVGFGAGHFYISDYVTASLKLVAFIFGLIFICSFPYTAKCLADDDCECECECLPVVLSIVYYLYLCGLAVWYIIDIVNFGKNEYKDLAFFDELGEGIDLEPW